MLYEVITAELKLQSLGTPEVYPVIAYGIDLRRRADGVIPAPTVMLAVHLMHTREVQTKLLHAVLAGSAMSDVLEYEVGVAVRAATADRCGRTHGATVYRNNFV